ncbi:MAG TPA: hypothetical protein VGM14_08865 [Streptosporangiaceae bacterium]
MGEPGGGARVGKTHQDDRGARSDEKEAGHVELGPLGFRYRAGRCFDDMLMTYKPIPPERVLAIVDDLFMPLVAIKAPGRPDRLTRR